MSPKTFSRSPAASTIRVSFGPTSHGAGVAHQACALQILSIAATFCFSGSACM